jgi:hypothetical protein
MTPLCSQEHVGIFIKQQENIEREITRELILLLVMAMPVEEYLCGINLIFSFFLDS